MGANSTKKRASIVCACEIVDNRLAWLTRAQTRSRSKAHKHTPNTYYITHMLKVDAGS